MIYSFRQLLFIVLFIPFVSSAEIIKIEATYIGNLQWEADNLIISQESIIRKEEKGPFVTVDPVWGKLRISDQEINQSKQSEIFITTTDVRQNNSEGAGYDPSWLPSLWESKAAFEILKGEDQLEVYYLKKQKKKEMIQWELLTKKNKETRERYNKLSSKEKLEAALPKYAYTLKPTRKHRYEYSVIKEYRIIFSINEEHELDYWSIVDSEKQAANTRNLFIVMGGALLLWLSWFFIIKMKLAVSKVKKNVTTKLRNIKHNRHLSKVRTIAEATAISETVKNELKISEPSELVQLKDQIAEAIENGNYGEADTLLKLAERLKKLDV